MIFQLVYRNMLSECEFVFRNGFARKTFNYLVEKIPDFSYSLNVHVGYVSEIGLEIEYYVSFD